MGRLFIAITCLCLGIVHGIAVGQSRQTTAVKGPNAQILDGCKKIDVDPPAYMTTYYIVQAPPERIHKAVGWVKHVEETVYPTAVAMLGYKPTPELYSVVFRDDYPKSPAVYTGVGRFGKTEYTVHRIYVRCYKLDAMPPWQTPGGVTHETIHALLHGVKKQADMRPLGDGVPGVASHLLEMAFELELYKRLNMQSDLERLWRNKVTQDPKGRFAVIAQFWKQYGWQPYQNLFRKLHENPDYKVIMDEATFAYEMSLAAGKDASAFFESFGWKIPAETKQRIREELEKPGK